MTLMRMVDCQKYLFLQSQAKNQVLCTHLLCVRVWQLNLSVSKPSSDKKAVTLHSHICSWQRLWSELGHLCELVQSSTLLFSFTFMFSFCLWSSFTNSWNSSDLFPHRKTALRPKKLFFGLHRLSRLAKLSRFSRLSKLAILGKILNSEKYTLC